MVDKKDEKVESVIVRAAAEFFEKESDRTSMITVTRAELVEKGQRALIYISVFPENKEGQALSFSKSQRSNLYKYLNEKTGLSFVPLVDVLIDLGEKNRQKLDNLSKEISKKIGK